jgi:hypothetical protein
MARLNVKGRHPRVTQWLPSLRVAQVDSRPILFGPLPGRVIDVPPQLQSGNCDRDAPTPEGLPITEYLPEDHERRTAYGLVLDPTPRKGRGLCS